MPRDNPEGSSSRCLAARQPILSPCALRGKSDRTIDPHALKIPAPEGRTYMKANPACHSGRERPAWVPIQSNAHQIRGVVMAADRPTNEQASATSVSRCCRS